MVSSMAATFFASLRAVGTAATMAGAGFYLHRRNFITSSGQKMMALMSQQLTIPAFLFARIIYCPSGKGSIDSGGDGVIVCPSVADRLSDLWMLLLWPIYVVLCGMIIGYFAARVSKTPRVQVRSCIAACAFPNSTGMVITLLSVIHKQFRDSTELGRIDPTAFLSVYMLLYPVLQWGVGGWLLAPDEPVDKDDIEAIDAIHGPSKIRETGKNTVGTEASPLLATNDAFSFVQQSQNKEMNGSKNSHDQNTRRSLNHILNFEPRLSPIRTAGQEEFGGVSSPHRVLLTKTKIDGNHRWISTGYIDSSSTALDVMVKELSFSSFSHHDSVDEFPSNLQAPPKLRKIRQLSQNGSSGFLLPHPESDLEIHDGPIEIDAAVEETPSRDQIRTMQGADILPLTETLIRIASKVFQPPVIASLLGLFIASIPELRGLFENIWGDDGAKAPFKFAFDGIYAVGCCSCTFFSALLPQLMTFLQRSLTQIGQAAVPINMMILGINLSSTYQKKKRPDVVEKDPMKLSNSTMLAVVVGKMIVMPIMGIASTWCFQQVYIHLPDEIDATCYLVMMIVFITPTANNVMVMVELSGSSSKEGMARLIGWQYAISPIVLSIVLSAVVSLASCHFDALHGEQCSI